MASSIGVVLCLMLVMTLAVVAPAKACCCWPSQFESKISVSIGAVGDTAAGSEAILMTGSMHADWANDRMTVIEHLYNGEKVVDFKMVEDFTSKVMHVILKGTQKCYKAPLPAFYLQDRCISDTMTKTGSQTLGVGDETLALDVYEYMSNVTMTTAKSYVTKKNCLPVFQLYVTPIGGADVAMGEVFTDMTLGIKDTSIHDIPDFCQGATAPPENDPDVSDAVARHMRRRGMSA